MRVRVRAEERRGRFAATIFGHPGGDGAAIEREALHLFLEGLRGSAAALEAFLEFRRRRLEFLALGQQRLDASFELFVLRLGLARLLRQHRDATIAKLVVFRPGVREGASGGRERGARERVRARARFRRRRRRRRRRGSARAFERVHLRGDAF